MPLALQSYKSRCNSLSPAPSTPHALPARLLARPCPNDVNGPYKAGSGPLDILSTKRGILISRVARNATRFLCESNFAISTRQLARRFLVLAGDPPRCLHHKHIVTESWICYPTSVSRLSSFIAHSEGARRPVRETDGGRHFYFPPPPLTHRCCHHKFNYINGTNIGTAKVADMAHDLHLSSIDYASEFDAGSSSLLPSSHFGPTRSTLFHNSAALR